MKKFILPILILSAVLLSGCSWFNKQPVKDNNEQVVQPTPTPPETQLPPEERPVITMTPDEKVQNIKLEITNLPEDVKTVDYELVYTSEGLQRGVLGTYTVSKGEAILLLGSCSSGVCKYDKDVTGGQLTIKYKSGGERILLREKLEL